MFLSVVSLHGWRDDVISDNFLCGTYALTPSGSKVMTSEVRAL